ncbi:MAG: hypothetical protein LBP88_05345 [Treponema sp.]|nr:hypothetical protein [Treponema sp.]
MKHIRILPRIAGLCLFLTGGMLWVSGCSGKQGFALSGRTNKNGTAGVVIPGTGASGIASSSGLLVPESPAVLSDEPASTDGSLFSLDGSPFNSDGSPPVSVLPANSQASNQRLIKVDPKYQANQGFVEIKEKMFIAQTNDVYLNPEDYLGKTIKLEGIFQTQSYSSTEPPYCFVIRYGPGCCGNDGNAGFEVMWEQADAIYPAENDWVEAIGVLGAYEEDGYPYICINLSSLKVLETRGQEFVTQ